MDLSNVFIQDLIDEILNRDDGLALLDSKVLADELIERNSNLDMFGDETLVQALRDRKNVESVDSPNSYKDYCVSIEGGVMLHGSGKVTILIVEGFY